VQREKERKAYEREQEKLRKQREAEEERAERMRQAEEKRRDRERVAEESQLTPVQRHHEELEVFNATVALHDLNGCVLMCIFCGALHWLAEKLSNSSHDLSRGGKEI
jgi:hypothetical protein